MWGQKVVHSIITITMLKQRDIKHSHSKTHTYIWEFSLSSHLSNPLTSWLRGIVEDTSPTCHTGGVEPKT